MVELGHPDDGDSGFARFFGALEQATNSGAAIARNIANGKQAVQTVQHEDEAHEQALALDRLKVERGDNLHLIWAVAGAAGIALFLNFSR